MLSVVYSSIATHPFDDAELEGLLRSSRDANERVEVTGVLFHKNGYFLQLLEGPDAAVLEKMATIRDDSRHEKVTTLLKEPIVERQFPQWTMAFAAADDEALGEVPGYRTAFADLEAGEDGSGPAQALRELVRWFQDHPARLS